MKKIRPLLVFFALQTLFNASANFVHSVTPTLIVMYNMPSNTFGLAYAAMAFTNFLFSPFWGKANNYLSSHVTIGIGGLGYALGQFFFLMARTQMEVILARGFSGIFIGAAYTSFLTYVVHHTEPRDCGRMLTVSATLQVISNSFGFFIGGLVGELGVTIVFVVQIICLAGTGILFMVLCTKDRDFVPTKLKPTEFIRSVNPLSAFAAGKSFLNKAWWILLIMCMLQNLGHIVFDQTLNYYLKDQFGFTSSVNGTIKLVIGIVTLIANTTVCLWIMNKTDEKKAVIPILLLAAINLFGSVVFTNFTPFVMMAVMYFACNSVSIPVSQDIVAQRTASTGGDSNLIMGFYNSLRNFGSIIGGLSAGLLYTASAKLPFIMAGVIYLLAAAAGLGYIKVVRKKK